MKDSTPRRFRAKALICLASGAALVGAVASASDAAAQPTAAPECVAGAPCSPALATTAAPEESPRSDVWVAPERPPAPAAWAATVAPSQTPARPAPSRTTLVPPSTTVAPSPRAVADRDRVADAHADRVMLMPTTYTHPEGTWYFSSTEVFVLQVGYAIDDRTQITVGSVPPVFEGVLIPFDLSLKHVFVDDDHVRFATLGAVTGLFGLEDGNFLVGRIGGVVTLCTTPRCDTNFNMASNIVLAGPAIMSLNSVGAIFGLSDWAAILVESDMSVPFGEQAAQANAALLAGAFRFKGVSWSIDLGLMGRIDADEKPVIPYVSVSYRSLP